MARPGNQRDDQSDDQRDELDDRHLDEVLQELRLVLPGTTVLFAFLLSVPFSARFEQISPLDRRVYFVAFIATALALVFLLAEAGYHRLRGKPYDKQAMIRTTSKQAVVGLGLLGVALVACVVLVANSVYGSTVAAWVTVPLAVGAIGMWFGIPLSRRWRGDPPSRRKP